jgi:putative transposase
LSKIGEIRFRGGYVIRGKIKTCTVTRKSTGKWFASVVYEPEAVGEGNVLLEEKKTSVGIDLGVSRFATLSDGTVFANPRFYERDMERIAVASRRMAKYEKGSKERLKYGRHLAHAYEHIVNRRKAFLDGVSRYLADHYDLIAMEDLNIKEMMESSAAHSLPRAIGSAAWNMLTTMTIRKAENAGGKVVLVDPRYTSQCCSGCGQLVPKDLSVRRHVCPGCGLDIDRDFNASLNILGLAVQTGPMCEYR